MIQTSLSPCTLFGRISVHGDKLVPIFSGGWRSSTHATVQQETCGYMAGALGGGGEVEAVAAAGEQPVGEGVGEFDVVQ